MEQDIAAQVVGLGGATDFSLWKLFLRADFVVKFVIILLIAASIFSWALIFDKFKLFKKINNSIEDFEKKNSTFYYNRALAYMGLNNIKEAESKYKLAIKYDSESLPALINLGNLYHQQDISEQAIKYYSKACLINPNDEKIPAFFP